MPANAVVTALVSSPAWMANPWTGVMLTKLDAYTDHYLSCKTDGCPDHQVLWGQYVTAYMCWRASTDAARERKVTNA